mmetsp:Transcript_30907/g.51174  ORF Transcript_30907/g.51174 Transcript_30907/m.51174 type:complete len:137 (-) Transcript_30907:286-696(-)
MRRERNSRQLLYYYLRVFVCASVTWSFRSIEALPLMQSLYPSNPSTFAIRCVFKLVSASGTGLYFSILRIPRPTVNKGNIAHLGDPPIELPVNTPIQDKRVLLYELGCSHVRVRCKQHEAASTRLAVCIHTIATCN